MKKPGHGPATVDGFDVREWVLQQPLSGECDLFGAGNAPPDGFLVNTKERC